MNYLTSLYNGLSGINSMSQKLNVTANNVANANTTAFKTGLTTFADVLETSMGSGSIGHGVQLGAISTSFASGSLENTNRSTDMAISGSGFFMLRNSDSTTADRYTRNGEFNMVEHLGAEPNAYNLVTPSGQFVQGYNLAASTVSSTVISDVLVKSTTPQSATTHVEVVANLEDSPALIEGVSTPLFSSWDGRDNGSPIANGFYEYKTSIKVYGPDDGTTTAGSPPSSDYLTLYYDSTANQNEKEFLLTCDPSLDQRLIGGGNTRYNSASDKGAGALLYGILHFTADGDLSEIECWNVPPSGDVDPSSTNRLDLASGESYYSFDYNFSGDAANTTSTISFGDSGGALATTSYASPSATLFQSQNGFESGVLQNIEVDRLGNVIGEYSNGQKLKQAQLVLADFSNLQGLETEGNNTFVATAESGAAILGTASQGSFGTVTNNALEGSNVDLGREMVDLITTQRAFQANSKSISTSDDIYENILQMIRR